MLLKLGSDLRAAAVAPDPARPRAVKSRVDFEVITDLEILQ
jgi:hypothetical protein